MSEPGRAVFLSYAREDTDSARRIAEALRSQGVEVWFDQNELRGGDAWDAKIRQQIDQCALFVPIISEHTESRNKGYFRLEWKLAVDQTHLRADGVPFVAPLAIDATGENQAIVPAEFLRVQWMRLPGALPTPQFVEQMKRLLTPIPANGMGRARPAERASPVPQALTEKESAAFTGKFRLPWWSAVTVAVLAIGAFAFYATRHRSSPAAKPPRDFVAKSAAKSIAVLPFANMSDDKESGFFADGIHEDILTSLYLIPELKVTSRTTVAQYRDTKKTMRQIGDELGVTYILQGSVRRDGKTVAVTGHLIRAATDEHVWAQRYNKELKDQFAIQSELAQAIANELQAKLSPQAKKLIERRPTENPAAYDLFLKAREIHNNINSTRRAELEKQESLLQAAVLIDPNFALAWAELAWVHGWTYFTDYDHTAARLAKAKAAIDTAIRLTPDTPEVMLQLGYFYYFGHRDFGRAIEQFEKALRMQPNAPDPRYAIALVRRRQGRWSEALEGFRAVAQVEPANYNPSNQLAGAAVAGRHWEMAMAERKRWYRLIPNPPAEALTLAQLAFWSHGSTREMEDLVAGLPVNERNSTYGREVRMSLALMQGDYAEVVRIDRLWGVVEENLDVSRALPVATALAALGDLPGARTRLEKFPAKLRARLELEPDNAYLWSRLGAVEAVLGHTVEALRCARKAVELVPESVDASDGPHHRRNLAFVYLWTSDKASALQEYSRLLVVPAVGATMINVHAMKRHPYNFPLQGDSRFEALLNDPKNNAPLF